MNGISSASVGINTESLKKEFGLKLDCVKDVSILFDKNKKQYSIKIPKEIVDIYNIKKGDIFRFNVEIREDLEHIKSEFMVVKNDRQKKK